MPSLKKLDVSNVKTYSVLQNGGHILGIDKLFITITEVGYNERYNIYQIEGYIQNAYNRENSTDTFDIAIYDSANAALLAKKFV